MDPIPLKDVETSVAINREFEEYIKDDEELNPIRELKEYKERFY